MLSFEFIVRMLKTIRIPKPLFNKIKALADLSAPVVVDRQPVNGSLDRDEAWKKLLSALKPNPKKVLQLIKNGATNGLSAKMIAVQFVQEPNWFTGVLNGGIQRNIGIIACG